MQSNINYDELAFDSTEYNRWCYNECTIQNQHPKTLHNKMDTNNENAHHLLITIVSWVGQGINNVGGTNHCDFPCAM